MSASYKHTHTHELLNTKMAHVQILKHFHERQILNIYEKNFKKKFHVNT